MLPRYEQYEQESLHCAIMKCLPHMPDKWVKSIKTSSQCGEMIVIETKDIQLKRASLGPGTYAPSTLHSPT